MALTPEKIWQNECSQKVDCIILPISFDHDFVIKKEDRNRRREMPTKTQHYYVLKQIKLIDCIDHTYTSEQKRTCCLQN